LYRPGLRRQRHQTRESNGASTCLYPPPIGKKITIILLCGFAVLSFFFSSTLGQPFVRGGESRGSPWTGQRHNTVAHVHQRGQSSRTKFMDVSGIHEHATWIYILYYTSTPFIVYWQYIIISVQRQSALCWNIIYRCHSILKKKIIIYGLRACKLHHENLFLV